MRRYIIAVAAVAALGATFVPLGAFTKPAEAVPVIATPHLQLATPIGRGSGVHIGNGYVLTAAHVVVDAPVAIVKDSEGRELAGTVLWTNPMHDIALLHIDGFDYIGTAPLSCAAPVVGQPIHMHGNPLSVTNVYTRGEIIGPAGRQGPWASVVPVDGTLLPGQSGGAVMASGRVVGINVGGASYQGPTGLSFVVPSSDICLLMARV